MTRKLIFSSLQWLDSRLCWEVTISMLGMFILSCILQRSLANKLQGPMLWPVLGITPSLFLHFNDVYDWVTESLIKAGGTFHFRGVWMGGVFGIVTTNPSNIEYMLKSKFENFPKGKYYRERFSDFLGDGIFNADDELWKEQRRIATSEMHSRQFVERSFQTMKDLVHQKLLKLLEKLVESEGTSFDLQEVLLRFTFDNICTAAFGTDPGCLALDLPEVPFAKAFEEAAELTTFRFLLPPFVWKPMRYFGIGYEKRLKEAIKIVHDFAEKTLASRRNDFIKFGSLNDHSDLLSRLIQDSEVPDKKMRFSDRLLRDLCISFVLAGRDTSSVALAWFFWLVHKNPEVETKILCEINEILGSRKSKINELRDVIFTLEELKRMVYLEAALSESLRLYPSVPIDVKEVKGDDVFPDGSRVKNGAWVFYCAFSMARMESIWGKDCLEFKPERWIKEGQFVSENQYKYAVFNAGPRLCLGKKFAYMQMKMVAASILLRYQVKVVEGHKVEPKLTTTLYMKHGLLVTLNLRLVANK
ncbi:cytochrome P450 86B1-like [Juglans microcarpa x Juglans regia]|uniref:cytochrome P450 86B1-like n=1 Tax=Juglans microcarpa x Juglans regia TaxID=2249226 RepID=UPI001B7E0E52|nr:cytochrome P450 86B1-like [Juglans microcarpa x Juglans regia]